MNKNVLSYHLVILRAKMRWNKIIFFLALTAVLSSCKKDVLEESEVPAAGPYASLDDFYDQQGAVTTNFNINTDIPNIITGPRGTQIAIPANSLKDSVGLPPPGNVNVAMREVYDIKTMVLSHTPTTSNGNILQSGGMFYL